MIMYSEYFFENSTRNYDFIHMNILNSHKKLERFWEGGKWGDMQRPRLAQ